MEHAESLARFSDRLGPVFVRDLRQGLRSNVYVWAFLLFHLAAVLVSFGALILQQTSSAQTSGPFGDAILYSSLSLGFNLLLPLSLFGTLQAEVGRGRNIELLLTAGITRWQIVREKLLVSVSLSGLLMISLVPYLLLRYFLGSVELPTLLGMVAATMAGNAAMNAIVIGASSFANPVGRVATIGYFYLVYTLTSASTLARSFLISTSPSFWSSLGITLVSILSAGAIAILALQLGRARIRLFENPIDPPPTAAVFALAFAVPIANGIATAAGGVITSCIILALFLGVALAIDRGPGRNNPGRGLQP